MLFRALFQEKQTSSYWYAKFKHHRKQNLTVFAKLSNMHYTESKELVILDNFQKIVLVIRNVKLKKIADILRIRERVA